MILRISKHTHSRKVNRVKKKIRIRKMVNGTMERPRLCVFRSNSNMYAQIIDDVAKKTIVSFSSLSMEDTKLKGIDLAKQVGIELAKLAIEKKIKSVVFDRNGYVYHGRVKSLADGAREGGLNF
ncbi:MAG: 50S ribosomal protein L18 [Pseudobdellovibrionaceae bacterium]